MNKIRFKAALVAAARFAGLISAEPVIVAGMLTGEKLVQPQKTLILAQHQIIDQTTGGPVEFIPDTMLRIGITDSDDLRKYLVKVYARLVESSDMVTSDNLQLAIVGAVTTITFLMGAIGENINNPTANEIWFQLDEDSGTLTADAADWGAGETHSYCVYYEIYELSGDIGKHSI